MKKIITLLSLFIIFKSYSQDEFSYTIIGDPYVNDSVEVIVKAKHNVPIKAIWLIKDNDIVNQVKVNCNSLTCELRTKVSLDYEGSVNLRSYLWVFPNSAIKEISTSLDFKCKEEYCEPDPIIKNFIYWMRNKEYDEAIISKYYSYIKNAQKRSEMKDFLNNSLILKLKKKVDLTFYDIIPTDANTVYTEMSTEKAELCVPSSYWPEFCPSPKPADYKMVEAHLERVFGVDYNITYIKRPTNYLNEIGPLTLNSDGLWEFNFVNLNIFEQQFKRGDIVHYGIENLNGKKIAQTSKGPNVSRMFSNIKNWFDIAVYTHELGHAYGLPHSFIDGTNPVDVFSLDGIMSNTYVQYTKMFDPLEPMERYALRPIDGYVDEEFYADEYNTGIKSTIYFNDIFKNVEPEITDFKLVNETGNTYKFEAIISNYGDIDCPFFNFKVFSGNTELINRVIENLEPFESDTFTITLDKNSLTGSTIKIHIDPDNLIKDEFETNNIAEYKLTSSEDLALNNIIGYPNPTYDEIYFSGISKVNATVSNALGHTVLDLKGVDRLSLKNLPTGIYYIQLKNKIDNSLLNNQKIMKLN